MCSNESGPVDVRPPYRAGIRQGCGLVSGLMRQSGEYGDLLDVIRETLGLTDFADIAEEARRFLSLPQLEPAATSPKQSRRSAPAPSGSSDAAEQALAHDAATDRLRRRDVFTPTRHYGFTRNRKSSLPS
jgi:hypothetical protein